MTKRTSVATIAIAFLFALAQRGSAQQSREAQEVLRIEKFLREDPNLVSLKDLDDLISPSYKGTDWLGGEDTKAELISGRSQVEQRAKVMEARTHTEMTLVRSVLKDLEVAKNGHDLVVTGTYVVQTPDQLSFEFADRFRLESGHWRMVESSESKHLKEEVKSSEGRVQ
jgi:hypothetical protein